MLDGQRFAAFLFDMDGTLLTSIAATERVWTRWAQRHDLDIERFLPTIHGRRAIDTIAAQAIPGLDIEAEARWVFENEMADVEGIERTPGSVALLSRLPPDRWAVVTSAQESLALRRMEAAGLPVPPMLVPAEAVAAGKPAPDGFLLAAKRLGVDPGACLVFEDAPAGIEAARAAGAASVAITGFQTVTWPAEQPAMSDYRGFEVAVTQDAERPLQVLSMPQPSHHRPT